MHSRYKSIDVPFILGYKLGSGKLLTAINAGVLLNIASKYSGVIPGIDGSGTAIGSGNVYKGNTGVSLYLSTSVSKKSTTGSPFLLSLISGPGFHILLRACKCLIKNTQRRFDNRLQISPVQE